jgi:hypothetical protein
MNPICCWLYCPLFIVGRIDDKSNVIVGCIDDQSNVVGGPMLVVRCIVRSLLSIELMNPICCWLFVIVCIDDQSNFLLDVVERCLLYR